MNILPEFPLSVKKKVRQIYIYETTSLIEEIFALLGCYET